MSSSLALKALSSQVVVNSNTKSPKQRKNPTKCVAFVTAGQLLFFHCKKAPRGAHGWWFLHHYFVPQYAGHVLAINKHIKFNQLKLIDGHYLDSEFVKSPFAYIVNSDTLLIGERDFSWCAGLCSSGKPHGA